MLDTIATFCYSGNVKTISLPRALGRQPLRVGRAAVPDLPAVPHLRTMHSVRIHPRTGLLRPSRGLPCQIPSGGEGARLWGGKSPIRL